MQPSTIIHYSSKDDSYDVIDMDRTELPRGGGATKKNKRIGGLDLRQDHFLFFWPIPPPPNGERTEESERKMRKEME